MSITKTVARKIKLLRNTNDIKQQVIASELHIQQSNYSRLESGNASITIEQLEKLSKIFRIPITDFFNEKNESSDTMSFKFSNNTNASGLTINQNQLSDNERKLYELLIESLRRQAEASRTLYEECKKNKSKSKTHMKTKITLIILMLLLSTLIFSFYNGNQTQAKETPEESTSSLDTAMEKYAGLYVYLNHYYYSVGKFPGNSKVHTQTGDKYLALDQKFIGKYFFVEDRFVWDTKKTTDYAGGYVAPGVGNLLLGVDGDGTIHIQNYDNYSKATEPLEFNLGGTTTYGKFVPRADGHYDLKVNNALYTWTKK